MRAVMLMFAHKQKRWELKSITVRQRASEPPLSRSNECFLLMSANPQSNPRLWCHLILEVAMLYGVCNVPLWGHAHAFHPLCAGVHTWASASACTCTCTYVCVRACVWLGYRVCLHYTLFRLIWLTLNRYWFPLLCSPRLSPSFSPFFLSPGSIPALAKQILCFSVLISFLLLGHLSVFQTNLVLRMTLAHWEAIFWHSGSMGA